MIVLLRKIGPRTVKKLAIDKDREHENHFSIGSWVEIVGGKWAGSLYITASDSRGKDNLPFIPVKICTVPLISCLLSLLNIKEEWVLYLYPRESRRALSPDSLNVKYLAWLQSFERPRF